MSRLIVKGLPKRLDEKELREIFSFAGQVTDAKIIRDTDGNSRQFAFIGYKDDKHAKNARKKLNGSYIRTSRVYVEMAKPTGDPSLPRPWSRHSKGSSAYEKRMETEEREQVEKFRADARKRAKEVAAARKKEAAEAARADNTGIKAISEKDKEGYQAFKDAVQGRKSKNPIWADAQLDSNDTPDANKKSAGKAEASSDENDDDDDDDDDVFDASNNTPADKITNEPSEEISVNPLALDSGVSDADYFKSKISSVGGMDVDKEGKKDDGDNEDDEEGDDESSEEEKEEKVDESKEVEMKNEHGKAKSKKYGSSEPDVDAGTTGRLFLRNLSFSVTEGELERLFEKFGTLAEVHIVVDSTTKKSRGVALISYVVPENAAKALTSLDGSVFGGRLLHILPGRPKPTTVRRGFAEGTVGSNKFKSARDEERLEAAKTGADGVAQNTMYMGADAVASAMAERLGTDKSTLFGTAAGESGTAAVRLAVAEATLQTETREFFRVNGVDLAKAKEVSELLKSCNGAMKRAKLSKTTFFVKNLPAGTQEKHLEEIFGKFGTIKRLKVAPNALLAFAEFGTPGEAKKAYGGCAYKRFRNQPLYLEWIPTDAITYQTENAGAKTDGDDEEAEKKNGNRNKNDDANGNGIIGGNNVNSGSVYVKNLNFDTKDDALKRHLQKVLKKRLEVLKGLRSATVATKIKDKSEEKLSMGFGFVEFSSYAIAAEAVKIAQGSELDGHKLELRLSKQQRSEASGAHKRKRSDTGGKACTKLMLRNVAFEASVREVRELFCAFGQLKSVRLPRKMNGQHRGFGFIDFVSVQEAKTAKESLENAHLYGRHLVIEYAEEDEGQGTSSMEKLVERAANEARKNNKRRKTGGEEADDEDDDEDERIRDELYAQ